MNNKHLIVALAGNPNSGKTTVFNAITGARQHVGNYPGVTVEKKTGVATHDGVRLEVVDLPGTYSLTAYSVEEVVARNVLLDEKLDVVVAIVDSSNLERNLYLATQLMELSVPLVLAFNMSDVAEGRGYNIDDDKLSKLLGVPIVKTVGHKGKGVAELLDTVMAVARNDQAVASQRHPNYGGEIEPHIRQLTELVAEKCDKHRPRWFAVKLLENDEVTIKRLRQMCGEHVEELLAEAGRLRRHIEKICGDAAEIILADRRYGFISGACTESVTHSVETRHERSDRIDSVMTNRYLGLPIFALLMFLVFQLTFFMGNPLANKLDGWGGNLAKGVSGLWGESGADSVLRSLLVEGVIEGVGAVLVFVPLIMLLFLAIAVLEDSGYMARAAFVIDRLMHKIGLHGKSFIPMLIGFGCTVPGIMATRTLETRRDRITTILVLPLMSCGARLPIYVLILGAFFPERVFNLFGVFDVTNQALWLFGIYVIGIVLAIIWAKVFRETLLKGEATPFVMELPPYRMPTLKGLATHMWERTWMYIKKAGTIILAIVIVLWALASWPKLNEQEQAVFARQRAVVQAGAHAGAEQTAELLKKIDAAEHEAELEHSAIGRIGKTIAPALAPCGFDWKISTALLGAFAAKEVFVGQMGVIYSVGEEADEQSEPLREKLQKHYTPLVGFCIMLFCLVSMPCMVTVAVTVREAGWRWAILQVTYLTVMAWVLTTIVYQVGSRLV
ncbi:MAG: ferrous iron transport protein B [Planctomycetota bacterium]|nr:ferrous iron transport protein B [Planctomycetota bacterium]